MAQAEAKLQAIEGLRTTLRLHQLTTHEHAKGALTPEHWQKLELLHDRPSGVMGAHMRGMAGQPENPMGG
jgi:hypothetical protein